MPVTIPPIQIRQRRECLKLQGPATGGLRGNPLEPAPAGSIILSKIVSNKEPGIAENWDEKDIAKY